MKFLFGQKSDGMLTDMLCLNIYLYQEIKRSGEILFVRRIDSSQIL